MITVRVSEDEFENLRSVTRSLGYRTVSDLARAAMNSVAGEAPPRDALASRLENLDERVQKLERLSGTVEMTS